MSSLCRAFGSLLSSTHCLLAAHVQRIIPTHTHFYSLLVKIILTTQLAGTRAISQCLGGAAAVLLTLCLDDLITVYSQTRIYSGAAVEAVQSFGGHR